jgi:hypothetical protein
MASRPQHLKRIVAAAGVCVLATLGLGAARRVLLPRPEDRCWSGRFDAPAWRDSTRAYSAAAVRGCMVDDLLRQDLLVGRSRAEVVGLLGEPRPTSYAWDYDLVYWLGPEGGLAGVDSEWLVLRTGTDGRVTEARVVTD